MDVITKDFFIDIDPFFKLEEVKIFWKNYVNIVRERNSLKPGIFVLSTHGIFLIKSYVGKKKGKRFLFMSYMDIVTIHLAGETLSFSSCESQVKIRHEDVSHIALLVFHIRQAQFPSMMLPLSVHFPTELEANLVTSVKPYSDSVFCDRFLSCSAHLKLHVHQRDISSLLELYDSQDGVIHINSKQIQQNLLEAILLTLAYEKDLRTLRVSGIDMSSFFSHCSLLFQFNSYIETIIIDNCSFHDSFIVLQKLLCNSHAFRPIKWSFINCDPTISDFLNLFEGIGSFGGLIKSLEFENCSFNEESLKLVFQAMFFNNCFHSIEEIIFKHIRPSFDLAEQLFDLLSCEWAIQSKCIRSLSVIDCGIDASTFLRNILSLNISLDLLRLSKNFFEFALCLSGSISLQRIQFLDLSGCYFISQNLVSLFYLFSRRSFDINGIDLSYITIFPNVFSEVLESLIKDCVVLPYLEIFIFDGFTLNFKQIDLLHKFLSLQPSLIQLSLNCSIDSYTNSLMPKRFIDHLRTYHQLEVISLRSGETNKYSYGPLLVSLIKLIPKEFPFLKVLDLTNQRIGSLGIIALRSIISKSSLSEVYFDGSGVYSLSILLELCQYVLNSKVTFATWPINDIERIRKNPIPCLDPFSTGFDLDIGEIFTQYVISYGPKCIETKESVDMYSLKRRSRIQKTTNIKPLSTINPTRVSSKEKLFQLFGQYTVESIISLDSEIHGLVKEIYGPCLQDNNPLIYLIEELIDNVSISSLTQKIGNT